MIKNVLTTLNLRASQIARMANMNEKSVHNVINGKNTTAQIRDHVIGVIATKYLSVRPMSPLELDQLCWKSLFGLAPYPSNHTTPRPRAQKKGRENETPQNDQANPQALKKTGESTGQRGQRALGFLTPTQPESSCSTLACPTEPATMPPSPSNAMDPKAVPSSIASTAIGSPASTSATSKTCPSSPRASDSTGQSAILQAPAVETGHLDGQPGPSIAGCDYSVPQSAAKHWLFQRTNAARNAFLARCYAHPWTFSNDRATPAQENDTPENKARREALSRRARVIRELNRINGHIKLREKAPDPMVTQRKDRIFNAVCGFVSWYAKNSTQSKGAYDLHSVGSRRETIARMLTQDRFIQMAADRATGAIPTVTQVETILRENKWMVDSRNDPEDFCAATFGTRPRYIGDEIMADWSGLPVKVDSAVMEVVNKRTGKKEKKYKKFGFHVAVDVASNFGWFDLTYGDNEHATWFDFLKRLFFRELQYAPGWLIMDKVSGVIPSLEHLNPDAPFADVNPVLIAIAGVGTRFNVHMPERANAKGNAEVAGKLFKHRSFHGVGVRKVMEQHLSGVLAKPRKVVCHSEVHAMFEEAKSNYNERYLCRDGIDLGARKTIWTTEQDVIIRRKDALVTNAEAIYEDIAARTKVVTCYGNKIDLRINGVRYYAELEGFEEAGIRKPKGDTALIIPNGLRASDDPDGYRVCLIQKPENGRGLPRFASLTAKVCPKDRLGYDILRPYRGEGYKAKPDTASDTVKRAKDKAENEWEKIVNGNRKTLKTGTDDVERHYE